VNPDAPTTEHLAQTFDNQPVALKSGMLSVVYLVGKILSRYVRENGGTSGLQMSIESLGLPIGAGLGSSASFSVAVAASCLRLQALLHPDSEQNAALLASLNSGSETGGSITPATPALDAINGWAFASEILLHATPSGLDNTTSCYGGLVRFSRRPGDTFQNITGAPALHILLVNTKVPRSTKELVAGVRRLRDQNPEVVNSHLDAMDSIANTFLGLVAE
jgi:mevalonate kinase